MRISLHFILTFLFIFTIYSSDTNDIQVAYKLEVKNYEEETLLNEYKDN